MNIVLASDDNYVPLLTISIVSILENNCNDFDEINVFILNDGISKYNIEKIRNILNKYNCNVDFIKTKNIEHLNSKIVSLERDNIASFTTYSRLFIGSLIPDNIDKIIYLDCDILVINSLKHLWNEDISEYYCAGVLDCCNTTIQKMLGISEEDNYINAGMLYINLKKWREDNIEEKFIKFIMDNQNRYYQHDQGIINNTFKDNIKIISPKYNLQSYFQFMSYKVSKKFSGIDNDYYSKEIIDEARNNPVCLHFYAADFFRPWQNEKHPYAKLYKKYAQLANFESVIDYSSTFNSKQKLFLKVSENNFGDFILGLTPYSLVKNVINKNAVKEMEMEFEKAKQN